MKNTFMLLQKVKKTLWFSALFCSLIPFQGKGQISLTGSGAVTENFNGMGSSATATLSTGFVVSNGTTFSGGTTATTQAAGTSGTGIITGTSSGGTYNWANGVTASSTDRALGFLSTGSFTSPRSIMLQITNNTGSTITDLAIAFDYEKYRSGTRAFTMTFFGGTDGSNWTSYSSGDQSYSADANNTTISDPPSSTSKSFNITGLSIANGSSYYLRWAYTGSDGSTNAQGLGIDNFSITPTLQSGGLSPEPTSQVASFTATGIQATQMTLNFSAPSTISNASGYIILMATGANPNDVPVDATGYSVGNTIGNATVAAIITNTATTSTNLTGLSPSTNYNFIVVPYGYDGSNSSSYNYYTDVVTLLSNVNTLAGTTATDYFRSAASGNWSSASSWESSSDNSNWISATLTPTSGANSINVQSGHTLTIDANVTAPSLNIDGILTFSGTTARSITVSNNVTIGASGSFITQSSGTATNTLTIGGNLTNNGTFDMSRGGSTLVCNVTFNKNGNQSVSGTGSTTRFNYMTLNMGTSYSNILEISSSNFQTSSNFLHPNAGSANNLLNGTLKLSGSFTFSGTFFQLGSYYGIVSTAGIWLNNSNVTITGVDDSYDLDGLLRVSAGTLNVGTASGNSIKYDNGSVFTLEGGNVTVTGRFSPTTAGRTVTYTQSGGTLTLVTIGSSVAVSKRCAFEMTSGSNFTWSGGTIVLQGGLLFYGGYDYSNTATTSNITGGTLQIANTSSADVYEYFIYSTNPIPNLNITGTNTPFVYLFGNTTISGDLSIAANAVLDAQSDPNAAQYEIDNPGSTVYSTTVSSFDISVGGNWTNNGTFTRRNKKVTLNGSANQSISGNVASTFYDLEISNANGSTINTSATVDNSAIFSNGDFTTASGKYLIFDENASVSGVGNSSHVNGSVQKLSSTISKFTFPIGDGTSYRSIAVTPAGIGATIWTAKYNKSKYADITVTGIINHVSGVEYWDLDRSGVSPENASIELSWDADSEADANFADLVVAHYNGTDWETAGGNSHSGNAAAGTVVSNANWSTYSPFTLGSTTVNNPLPITLIDFSAQCDENRVELKWSTASEINNDYFTVESSENGIQFDVAGFVSGAGNSNSVLSYSLTDKKTNGKYYRLKQTDFDGQYTFSEIVAIDCGANKFINVFPKYSEGIITVNHNIPTGEKLAINVVDNLGRRVFEMNPTTSNQNNTVSIPLNQMSSGIYYLTIISDSKIFTEKFYW